MRKTNRKHFVICIGDLKQRDKDIQSACDFIDELGEDQLINVCEISQDDGCDYIIVWYREWEDQ